MVQQPCHRKRCGMYLRMSCCSGRPACARIMARAPPLSMYRHAAGALSFLISSIARTTPHSSVLCCLGMKTGQRLIHALWAPTGPPCTLPTGSPLHPCISAAPLEGCLPGMTGPIHAMPPPGLPIVMPPRPVVSEGPSWALCAPTLAYLPVKATPCSPAVLATQGGPGRA